MSHDKQLTDLLARCQYKYKDLTKRDAAQALSYFKELVPAIDKYVYPDGTSKDLITIYGTIPVQFRNQRYNIPVQLYLADTHPYTPPLVYVRPTADMNINVSETVKSDGRVVIPYLVEWNYPHSDMYVLLNMLTIKFSDETPLFAKPANRPGSNGGSSSNIAMQPQPTASVSSYGPPYPLYPSSNLPYPTTTNPYYPTPMYPTPTPQQPTYPGMHSSSGSNLSSQGAQRQPLPPIKTPGSYPDETIKPETYKLSLISAVQDKARLRLNELLDEKRAEIDSLKRINQDLNIGDARLNEIITESNYELSNLNKLTAELKRRIQQIAENTNRIQHRNNASIEDAIVAPAPLYRQLFQLFAEELAIQDLLFYLSEGLTQKTISLDSYLKQVRALSRKQFILRATMQRAREKAGLPF